MATIKNLVKFAAKFLNMAKSKVKVKKAAVKGKNVKPAAKAKSKPAAKKVSKPVKKVAPKAKKVTKPVKKVVAKPSKKVSKAKPVVKKRKAAKSVVKSKVKAKPITKKTTKKSASKAKVAVKSKLVKKALPSKKVNVTKKLIKKPAPAKPVAVSVVKPSKKTEKTKSATAVKAVAPAVVKIPGKKGRPAKPVEKKIVREALKPEPKQLYRTEIKLPKPTVSEHHNIPVDLNLRYSDEELREFKELIDKKMLSAREELKYLKEALDNHNDSQAGSKAWNMEEGTDTSEMETLMNQISRQHQYIRNLELALVRIENKTYGICRVTGRLIPKERLRVVPHATLSLEAKMHRKADDVSTAPATAAPPSDFSEGFED